MLVNLYRRCKLLIQTESIWLKAGETGSDSVGAEHAQRRDGNR